MSNFGDLLKETGLTAEAVAARSKAIERQTLEQRALAKKRANARREKKPYADLQLGKPERLGRGVTVKTVKAGIAGNPLPRLARKKLLRAVNSLLQSQKKEPRDVRALFGDAKSKKGKGAKAKS